MSYRRNRTLGSVLASLGALGILFAQGQEAGSPADPAVAEVVARFSQAQAAIETMQAEFEERKKLTLLKDEVVLTGTFYHSRPMNFLWDYRTPSPKKILLTPELLLAYYPDLNKAEEVNVRRWNKRIRRYLQLGVEADELQRDYDLALAPAEENEMEGTDLLILTPKSRRSRSKLDHIRIWVDSETGHTRRTAYLDESGDYTTFTFQNLEINADIPDSLYSIDLPRDVRMGDSFTGFSAGQ